MRALQNKRAAWAALFILSQLFAAQVFSLLYFFQSGVYPRTFESALFAVAYWFGHFGFLAFLCFLILWLPARLIAASKWGRASIAFITTFFLVVLICDSIIYGQYRFHINLVVLDLFFKGGGQIISFSLGTWLIAFGFLFAFWALNIFISQKIWHNLEYAIPLQSIAQDAPTLKRFRALKNLVWFYFFCLVFSHGLHAYSDARYNAAVTRMAGVFPFSEPLKAKSFFSKLGLVDLEEYKKRKMLKKSFGESEMQYPLRPLEYREGAGLGLAPQSAGPTAQGRPMNIIWLVVDSLRGDMLTAEVMPNTFELAQRSVIFKNHISNSNSTRHGIFGLFYGLPGAYFEPALRSQTPPVFMKQLVAGQYEFFIYANAPLTKPEFDQTVFAEIESLRKFSKADTVYGRDIEINDLVLKSLSQYAANSSPDKKPFFSFVFYDAPHGYSYPPDYKKPFQVESDGFNYLTLNVNSDPTLVRDIYKNSVHFVDHLIGQVLKTLKEKGLDKNTIVLVTGDHGQEFNDTKLGYWGHNSNYSRYQTQVPLVIYWPGRAVQEISYMTSHFDVSTTFMKDYFNVVNAPEDFSSGFNLFDSRERKWILMGREGDYAIFQNDQIVVISPTGDYEVLDQSYHPIERGLMRTEYVQEALREMSRFLAR